MTLFSFLLAQVQPVPFPDPLANIIGQTGIAGVLLYVCYAFVKHLRDQADADRKERAARLEVDRQLADRLGELNLSIKNLPELLRNGAAVHVVSGSRSRPPG